VSARLYDQIEKCLKNTAKNRSGFETDEGYYLDCSYNEIKNLNEEISLLKQAIKVLGEANGFYADEADAFDGYHFKDDESEVCEGNLCIEVLGKRARVAQQKAKQLLGDEEYENIIKGE
jgi:hypothetical protein